MVLAPEGENASSKKAPIGRFLDAQAMVTALLCVLFAIMYLDRVNIAQQPPLCRATSPLPMLKPGSFSARSPGPTSVR